MLTLALTLYFLLIIIFALVKTPQIESPTLNLFKSMFPSWKFFDESINTPVLLYRLKNKDQFANWVICIPPPKNKWTHLFYNPHGNYYLAYHSHIQQALEDLANLDDDQLERFHHHVSYKTTENFVRYELLKKQLSSEFQFKISNIKRTNGTDFEVMEDILLSPTLNTTGNQT